jgi:hypothetical protein
LTSLTSAAAATPPPSPPTTTIPLTAAAYRVDVSQINHTYATAIASARAALKRALTAAVYATSPANAVLSANGSYTDAVIAATAIREASLEALGPPPPGPRHPADTPLDVLPPSAVATVL